MPVLQGTMKKGVHGWTALPNDTVKTEGTCWNKCLSWKMKENKNMTFSLREHTEKPDQ